MRRKHVGVGAGVNVGGCARKHVGLGACAGAGMTCTSKHAHTRTHAHRIYRHKANNLPAPLFEEDSVMGQGRPCRTQGHESS